MTKQRKARKKPHNSKKISNKEGISEATYRIQNDCWE
jgi:hypothetical protein